MTTVTIPATYIDGIIKPTKPITKTPTNIFITFEYIENNNRLEGLTKKEIEEKFYDKNDDSYGPFEGEEAVTFLKSLRK